MDAVRALVACIAFVPLYAWSQPAPSWDQAKKDVVADYKKQQPGDKVLELTGPERKEGVAKVIRYFGGAQVERSDKSKSSDRFWVEYRLIGSKWELHAVKVYEQNTKRISRRRRPPRRS